MEMKIVALGERFEGCELADQLLEVHRRNLILLMPPSCTDSLCASAYTSIVVETLAVL